MAVPACTCYCWERLNSYRRRCCADGDISRAHRHHAARTALNTTTHAARAHGLAHLPRAAPLRALAVL